MDYQDYYQTLGLTRNASQPEIKKAFRKLAREHHPDKRPGDAAAERRFKEINEANAVLSDPEKRRKYDLLGANWESYSQAGAGGPSAGAIRSPASGAAAGQAGNVRYEFRTSGGARAVASRTSSGRSSPADEPGAASAGRSRHGRPHVRGDPRPDGPERGGPDQRRRRAAAGRFPGGRRSDRRDQPRGGLPRHEPADRHRRQAPRDDDPARCRQRNADQADRPGPRWWRRRRRRPRPAPRHLHPARRRPRTRAADHPARGAARRRSPGHDAQGPGVAEDPAGHAERPNLQADRPGHAPSPRRGRGQPAW